MLGVFGLNRIFWMDVRPILLILERQVTVQPCLVRALMLARYLHAPLEILYPAQTIRAGSPEEERRLLTEESRYLAALQQSIQAPDVSLSVEAANTPLTDAVITKTRARAYALVIKTPWHRQSQFTHPTDWQLLQVCAAPLLLTEGRPWRPQPRFLAAVDLMSEHATVEPRAVLAATTALRQACSAELDLIYVQSEPAPVSPRMEQLSGEFDVSPTRLHVLPGRPADTLRQIVAMQGFDLLSVGGPAPSRAPLAAHQELPVAMALTGVACDLLSVPDSAAYSTGSSTGPRPAQ